jgi:hypothetical protein
MAFAGSSFAAGPNWANTFMAQTPYLRMTASTVQNNVWTMRTSPNGLSVARGNAATLGGWYVRFNVCLESVATTSKIMIGLINPTLLDPTAGQVPSNETDCAFFGFDNGDTNWSFMTNDNAGTCTKTSTGFAAQTTSKIYSMEIWCAGNGGDVFYRMTDQSNPGSPASGQISSNLPTSTTNMVLFMYMQGNTAGVASAATTVGLYHAYAELAPTFTI